MPTLIQVISSEMTKAGYTPPGSNTYGDLDHLQWYDEPNRRWVRVSLHNATQIANIDVTLIAVTNRERIRFVVNADARRITYRWDNSSSSFVPIAPERNFVLTPEHLTGV